MKENLEGGTTWAFEVGSQSIICPIVVEDLNPPRQMLVEVRTFNLLYLYQEVVLEILSFWFHLCDDGIVFMPRDRCFAEKGLSFSK